MNDYATQLAALDVKRGRVHTVEDWHRVGAKPPEAVTDDDLTLLGFFAGESAVKAAIDRRQKAIYPEAAVKAAAPQVKSGQRETAADRYAEMVCQVIKSAIHSVVGGPKVDGRFAALEQRIAELESQPRLKFVGVYQDTGTYVPGDAATRQGGLWICKAATTGEFDHACWQLAVKKGSAQ